MGVFKPSRVLIHICWSQLGRTALALALVSGTAACGDTAKLLDTAGMGPNPIMPAILKNN